MFNKIWNIIQTSYKNKNKFCIIPFTKNTYIYLKLLKIYYFKDIIKFNNFIIIYYNNTFLKFNLKFLNFKNKKNIYKNLNLKYLLKSNIDGIISTSKGLTTIRKSNLLKQGGNLICLINKNIY